MRDGAQNRGRMWEREMLRAGYRMKMSWRDRDALISIGATRDSFEIDSGMRVLNSKLTFGM